MTTPFTIQSIQKSKCAHLNLHISDINDLNGTARKSKYGNNKKEVDGIVFDSEKEAKRYGELKLLLKAGEIGLLELQVPYELNPGGTHSLKYIADFVYYDQRTGEKIIEDVKCQKILTQVYKKKRRLMKKIHGIKIKET